ncbi:MAG: ArsR family transcriptional regulator [Candidatus Heimdallarchaeota archaeon]|nr:ArsR family transcriptional regulator [Candidatus Heimdallarchaeota archaeon]
MGTNGHNVSETPPIQDLYAALGHAIRYDIVQYLGTFHRPVHYKELVEWLNIKPGSFYFHMKKLEGLVAQDDHKRFYLTPSGLFTLDLLRSGENLRSQTPKRITEETDEPLNPPERFKITLFGEFVRRKAFNAQYKSLMVIILLLQIFILELAKLGVIPFYFDGRLYINAIVGAIELILTFMVVWILLELISRFLSPIKGFSIELLVGIPLAMSPLFIYPVLVFFATITNLSLLLDLLAHPVVSVGSLFLLQILSAIFLIQLLQVIKSLNFERALIPVFILLYGFSILTFILTNLISG